MMTLAICILVLNLTCVIVSILTGNWMQGFVVGWIVAGLTALII
jgi:hypothetical protein